MAASSTLLAARVAEGLCPRDGNPAAPFKYCESCRAYRTRASNESAARKAGRLPAKALDSGGFTELQMHGQWTLSAKEYTAEVRRFRDEIGGMLWAAPQDWMCEPIVLAGGDAARGVRFAGTHLTVEEHQRRTVENLLELQREYDREQTRSAASIGEPEAARLVSEALALLLRPARCADAANDNEPPPAWRGAWRAAV